ncbi:MAG: hypothetical protein IKO67_03425 [Bacteroidaceae bacterium]|nr:hypothetical protein [Bacteroidaceae bacterium]
MKKFLLLMLSVLMGAMMSSVDARWELGDQKGASDIKVGDTIVLEFIDLSHYVEGRFLAGSAETPAGVISDENIYVVEEGPLDIRTGAPTVYLKHVVENGYLKYNGGWQTISYDPDPANAANMQILSCAVDIPWSNTYSFDEYETIRDEDGKPVYRDDAEYTENEVASWRNHGGVKKASDLSVGFCYSTGENLYSSDDYHYLGSWDSADNIWFWQYTDTNQWNVYGVNYISDLQGDLQTLIDLYLEEGEYVAGTDPGYYEEDVANAYNEAMQEALTISITGTTDEEFSTAITNLKTAHAAIQGKQIPITEGYYYFVIANDGYLNEQGIEKAARVNVEAGKLGYKTFDPEDAEFVFEVTKADDENEWWVQSLITGKYVGQPSNWYGVSIPVTDGKEEPQNIRYYNQGSCTGKWFWGSHKEHNTSYTAVTGTSLTTNEEGNLVNWGQWNDGGTVEVQYNCWYLRKITDEATIEGFEAQKQQAERTASLRELVSEATELYSKLFVFSPDYSNKLIKRASGGANEDPAEDNQITFSNIRKQGVAFADKYEFLIDEDDTTYMQGSGYMTIKLDEPKQVITFVYNTRDASGHGTNPNWQKWGAQERPRTISLYGANTEVGDTVYGGAVATGIDMGSLPLPATYTFDFGRPVNRVAYQVNDNANGGDYFTLSEFQMYEAKVDEASSQYYTTEGLKDKADAMNALLPEMRDIVAANTATDENVQAMQDALAAVKEMYGDTTELAALIAESEALLNVVEIGEDMGQLSDESLKTALEQAIADARENAFVSPISVAAVKTAEKAIKEAKAAFMAGIKSFEVGKWYFITNTDTERSGEAGAEDAFCQGNAIYLNKNTADGSITKWGLFDESSMTLNADNNPSAMWRFVPVEGSEYYAIQNLYTGYYLGDYAGDNINLPVSETPVPYEITISGNGGFNLFPRGPKNKGHLAIWPEGFEKDVVCHPSVDGASSWTFVEIDPEEQQAISISIFAYNLIDVMAVPFAIDDLADYNDDVHTYAIKKMTQEEQDGELVTTVELYEKSHFDAGEPCIIGLGNWQDDEETAPFEPYDLVIPFPEGDIVDHTHNFVANGIFGGLHSISLSNVAVSTGKDFIPYSGGFGAMTGFIDPACYRTEVEGVETAVTFVINGLNPIPDVTAGDVDGDGNVNTSDVVAVYNFIIDGTGVTKEAADVNGDGDVNSTDVVAIYNLIIYGNINGQSAGSKSFYPEADGDDTEVTVLVGSTDNRAEIPVTVYLTNPTVDITAVEANLEAPVSVDKFVYDDEEEDYKTADTDRWGKKHTVKYAAGTAAHGANVFFISITNPDNKAFKEKEGAVVTVYFDGSELSDGDYVVKMTSSLAVGTDAKSYKAADMDAKFSIKDGKVTAVAALTAEAVAAGKAVYTVDGKKVAAPAKGQIYVVDGKAVKF